MQQCSTHCHPVCTEDLPKISLGTYYSDVCDLTTIHHSVKKKKKKRWNTTPVRVLVLLLSQIVLGTSYVTCSQDETHMHYGLHAVQEYEL